MTAERDLPCAECGHSDRMHVRGMAPRYAGCMVMDLDAKRKGRSAPVCPCKLTPEQVREASDDRRA